jgi:Flp pilus assembly protein TadD
MHWYDACITGRMNAKQPSAKPFELELVAIDPPPGDPSQSNGPPTQTRSLGITNADFYLEEAAREYQNGKVDQALWSRTILVAGDDESIAIAAYLRGRAAALRLEQAARSGKPASGGEGAKSGAVDAARRPGPGRVPGGDGPATTRSGGEDPAAAGRANRAGASPAPRTGSRRVPRNVIYLGAAAAALSFVGVLLWVMAAPRATENARQAVNAAVKRPDVAARAAPTAPVVTAAEPTLADKVDEMKRNGNWNVMVLYANEWTRKEPTNAAAWRELGLGYASLRQFDDAREAAMRAVTLAPTDAVAWNGLGRVNVALERWPEAGAAFDKALGVRADDVEALCGAITVARRDARPKDADALARRVSDPAACRGSEDSESVAVTPRGARH